MHPCSMFGNPSSMTKFEVDRCQFLKLAPVILKVVQGHPFTNSSKKFMRGIHVPNLVVQSNFVLKLSGSQSFGGNF